MYMYIITIRTWGPISHRRTNLHIKELNVFGLGLYGAL